MKEEEDQKRQQDHFPQQHQYAVSQSLFCRVSVQRDANRLLSAKESVKKMFEKTLGQTSEKSKMNNALLKTKGE